MSDGFFEDDGPVQGSKFSLSSYRKVMQFARPYGWHFVGIVITALLAATFDVLLPFFLGWVIDLAYTGEYAAIQKLIPGYALLILILGIVVVAFINIVGSLTAHVAHDIRRDCFDRLQDLEFGYFDKRPTGWLMSRLTSDCNKIGRIMGWATLDVVWGTSAITAVTVTMLIINPGLALAVIAIVPFLAIAVRFFQVRLIDTSRAVRRTNSRVTAMYNESILGVRTTKTLVREDCNAAEFNDISDRMCNESMDNALWGAIFMPVVAAICAAGIGLALFTGGILVVSEDITPGTLIQFMSYAIFLQEPVREMARQLTMVQSAQPSAERIADLLETDPKIADSPEVIAKIEAAASNRQPGTAIDGLPDRIHRVRFDNVTFGYNPDRPVLHDFSLTVEPGQTIALVGPTGGGKSTIVSLLCRFYEPTTGRILLDETDYRDRSLDWYQSRLGIVLQQPHLFTGTVAENIRYGRLDATDEEIAQAAELVRADRFINELKDRYNTQVGSGGVLLSTGQKQLIALARAVIADPEIFVMDEATSSVDTETERLIQDAVERVLADRIAFVIAHRLSTIRSADQILVIQNGQLTESGNHDQLLQTNGHYAQLYRHHLVSWNDA
ncbi:ABC transporter ATP-binding protein [Mucisphaera sp.]|uniref:ABC transporter ATP-binding protein n=1 Tax=Mucisphaera sp. TaxID=2913024 RepID=UPI003D0BA451